MIKAIWNGYEIARSDHTILVEGNHYFPPESVDHSYLLESQTHTRCPWKGVASYFNISVEGQVNPDAAWYYPAPNKAAENIKNYVAFWKGVKIVEEPE